MKQHIYADNAATTQLDRIAFEAMMPWLFEKYGNASQPYAFAREPREAIHDARVIIAHCIGADPEEIFFTSGGTESDNWAIKSCLFGKPGCRAVLTSAFEHHAVLHSCKTLERLGHPVIYVHPTTDGQIAPEILKNAMTENVQLISIMYANNEIGSIQPIQELCRIAHGYNIRFHTDAVQAIGHVKLNVHDLGIDMLSASAHKFNGPKGIGFLYIRKGIDLMPLVDGGAQEFKHRAGTENVASIVGMAAALKLNCDALYENQKHLRELEQLLLARLTSGGVSYIRNGGNDVLPGLLSLSFAGKDGEMILHRMDLKGISISTGSACDSANAEISHVLKAIKLDESYAKGTIRISLGKNNTRDDVLEIVSALVAILK